MNKYYLKLKMDVLNAYSDRKMECYICKINDFRCLTIDHVNDDGSIHKLKIAKEENLKWDGFRQGAGTFYSYLRRKNYPNEPPLQVLCANCQSIKRWNKGRNIYNPVFYNNIEKKRKYLDLKQFTKNKKRG